MTTYSKVNRRHSVENNEDVLIIKFRETVEKANCSWDRKSHEFYMLCHVTVT